jgi:hypothetical protein
MHVYGSRSSRWWPVVWALVLTTAAGALQASADPRVTPRPGDRPMVVPADRDPHLRITDARLRHIVDHASEISSTFHALVDRIEHSDVVAYVVLDMALTSRTRGRLSFVGMAAGIRYVKIEVGYVGPANHQAVLIGHELRHAVEVADAPTIVDVVTFERAYARIGFLNLNAGEDETRSYETKEARDAGKQILRELLRKAE